MVKKLSILILACTLIAGAARAEGEHLEPEPSIFTGIVLFNYYKLVLQVFGKASFGKMEDWWRGGRVAVVALPSFQPEYGIAITAKDGDYSVSYVRPKVSIWHFLSTKSQKAHLDANPKNGSPDGQSDEVIGLDAKRIIERLSELPASVDDIQIETCVRNLDEPLAQKIFQIWDKMLKQTRYAEHESIGNEGTIYHFTMHAKRRLFAMGGWVWSPPEESETGGLVAITESLRRYCLEGGKNLRQKLTQQVDTLSKRLKD